jgi:CelD/BcsL family acetyltransferase involved in cellulose biosynthesis
MPWVVAVLDGSRWEAAALLARRRHRGLTEITGLGQAVNDHGRLPARSAEAAAALVEALVGELLRIRGPWRLRVEQLPAGDPVAHRLALRLRTADLAPGVGMPRIDLSFGRAPNTYLRKKFRQQVNAARRRFEAAGVRVQARFLRTVPEIRPLLGDLLEVRRARDRDALYAPDFDDRVRVAWWRDTILDFAEQGRLELTVLDVGAGLPAAYNIAILDGTSYRCWDGRLNPAWHDQWPGQLLFGELLPRVIEDPQWTEVDYQRGENPFKLRTANDIVPTSHLLAWSSPAVRAVVEAPAAARGVARSWKSRHPAAERIVRELRARRRGLSR